MREWKHFTRFRDASYMATQDLLGFRRINECALVSVSVSGMRWPGSS